MMTANFIAAAIAYLLGSIPFGFLLVLAFRKEDIRESGSGNIGATNVIRTGSRWLGMFTLLLDTGKGYAAVAVTQSIIARWFDAGNAAGHAAAIAAVFAVAGHVFPVWLGFKGGKGVATALGVFLALVPLAALCALGTFIVLVRLTRYVSLASVVSCASFPLFVWLWGRVFPVSAWSAWLQVSAILVPAIIVQKHTANIRRLLSGTEYRFGGKGSAAA